MLVSVAITCYNILNHVANELELALIDSRYHMSAVFTLIATRCLIKSSTKTIAVLGLCVVERLESSIIFS